MNEYEAYAHTGPGGYFGMFRRVDRAEAEHVCRNGVPVLFQSHMEALCAARGALIEVINGDIRQWGDRPSMTAQSVAERAFGTIVRNGRSVKVERRGRR